MSRFPGFLKLSSLSYSETDIHSKMKKDIRVALTGFMGVGKSSVARHLASTLRCQQIDLDRLIERNENSKVVDIIDQHGIEHYRRIETMSLTQFLETSDARILSLGGGTWTMAENRELLKSHGFTSVWLESTFEHCWLNISYSRKERPLARDKQSALKLFEERQKVYCLADWHIIIRPDFNSFDVARQIAEEIFS
ncbi:shikimate kinase [soil metagenome]